MIFLQKSTVVNIIQEAIKQKKLVYIEYYTKGNPELKKRKKAPFDLGSTNPSIKIREKNKDILYMFCFNHTDVKTGRAVPQVHGHSSLDIVRLEILEEKFDPVELTKIHYFNTGFNYQTWKWAIVSDRNWY